MTTSLTNLLTSDSFRLLCLLDDLQTETVEGRRVRESQDEIAALFHVSKGKLNPLMQALVNAGCIQKFRQRSGYVITPKGEKAIGLVRELDALDKKHASNAQRKRVKRL